MPIIPAYEDGSSADQERIAELIRARRPGRRLINLDRMLLLSAPFAEGYNALLPRVRNDLTLPSLLRELAICAVAAVTGAAYEQHHHRSAFLAAGGTKDQLAALEQLGRHPVDLPFDRQQQAVLRLAVESTEKLRLSAETVDTLRQSFPDPRQIFELISVVATYNMVCRLVLALDIPIEQEV